MNSYEILGTVLIGLICLIVGLVCLVRPTTVRDYALRTSPRWNPFRGFIETSSYLWSLRLTGVTALLMFLLVVATLIWGRE